MKIIFSEHAKGRMRERNIAETVVMSAILLPERVEVDKHNQKRYMVKKKIAAYKNKVFLLLVVYEILENELKVIAVISTSKVSKYL